MQLVDADFIRQLVKEGIDGLFQGAKDIHPTVASLFPVAIRARPPRHVVIAAGEHLLVRSNDLELKPGQTDERLEG